MHSCLAVLAAANAGEARSASRAWSVPISSERTTKIANTAACDGFLHFMIQLPGGRKDGECGARLIKIALRVFALRSQPLLMEG